MNDISFKSAIRPVSPKQFNNIVSGYGKERFVDFPWTIKESVLSQKVYTKGVEDCSFFGLTDGVKVLGMHICPTITENFDFTKIANFIKSKIDLKNIYLQGFVLGGRRHSENNFSFKLFDNFIKLLEENNIPYSKFKGSSNINDIAYDSITDEWIVSTPLAENENIRQTISAKTLFENIFDEVSISKEDEAIW